ncbi:MAG: methyl-accepting chemotaxis protein [Eubacteriales bacterium]|nr:methyl-accepting chemotaxis protein [Eubacteriales bacterium]
MKREVRSEAAAQNMVGIISHGIEAVIITLAYVAEILKGARSLTYVIFISVLAIGPVLAELVCFAKNRESRMIKHLLGYGYAALYIAVMLTTNNIFAFVYVIPMLIAITVYNDVRYSVLINVGVIIVNAAEVVILLNKGVFTADDSAAIEIQLFVMVLVMAYSIYTSVVVDRINKAKLKELERQQQQIQMAQDKTINASRHLVDEIDGINGRIKVLSESLNATKEAMEEVNSGSTDTAAAVQKQLEQTGQIQDKVEQVAEEKDAIIKSTEATKEAIAKGNEHVSLLVSQVAQSVESGSNVNKELSGLGEYMNQMNSIVDIISGIAEQTSLLALNASIEAARAGEAGKGFAVVAGEISQMANQTQDATVNITGLIENVSAAISRVIDVSGHMIEMIKGQDETTALTAESFEIISSNSQIVAVNADRLSELVGELELANKEIVDSISTISAISEEVAAHASDTLSSSEQNIDIIDKTYSSAVQLAEFSRQLTE